VTENSQDEDEPEVSSIHTWLQKRLQPFVESLRAFPTLPLSGIGVPSLVTWRAVCGH